MIIKVECAWINLFWKAYYHLMKLAYEKKGVCGSSYTFNFLNIRDKLDNL